MAPLDPGVTRLAAAPPVTNLANEFFSFTCNNLTIKYLEKVGTFDINNPLEIRDNAAASTAFGVNGFNVPSLLSINYHAPYLHRGQAQTLRRFSHCTGWGRMEQEFPPTTTIQSQLTAAAARGSAGVPEIYRWHHPPLPLRGGRILGILCEVAGHLSDASANDERDT